MIEQIKNQTAKNGNITYWIGDSVNDIPYTAVTVQPDGNYYLSVYGHPCFARSSHDKILKHCKPSGKNITVERYYNKVK